MRYRDPWLLISPDFCGLWITGIKVKQNYDSHNLWVTYLLVAWSSCYKDDGLHLLSQNTSTTTHRFRKKPKQDSAIITNSSTTRANILSALGPFKLSSYQKATRRSLSLVTSLLGTLPHTSPHHHLDIPVVFLSSALLWSYRKASQHVSQTPIYRFHHTR
jgi:hypothetical protein